jgi:opacity protein-like surface antigen
MPELQLQFQLPRRLAPYFGIGTGFASDMTSEQHGGTDSEVTFSGSAGLRAAITRRVGLRVELRIREFGTGFYATTADWTLGAAWRF